MGSMWEKNRSWTKGKGFEKRLNTKKPGSWYTILRVSLSGVKAEREMISS